MGTVLVMQRDRDREMSMWDWFKPQQQRAQEAKAKANHLRAALDAAYDGRRADILGMGEVPRSTDEARAYAIALDWVNRRGANEASRLADLTVRNVQMLSRGS